MTGIIEDIIESLPLLFAQPLNVILTVIAGAVIALLVYLLVQTQRQVTAMSEVPAKVTEAVGTAAERVATIYKQALDESQEQVAILQKTVRELSAQMDAMQRTQRAQAAKHAGELLDLKKSLAEKQEQLESQSKTLIELQQQLTAKTQNEESLSKQREEDQKTIIHLRGEVERLSGEVNRLMREAEARLAASQKLLAPVAIADTTEAASNTKEQKTT